MSMKHLSYSSLSSWETCPERFRRAYIERERIPAGIAALSGRSVHAAAEINFTFKKETGKDRPLDEVQDAAHDAYVQDISENGVFIPLEAVSRGKRIVSEGLDKTIAMAAAMRGKVAPRIRKPWMVEKKLKLHVSELPLPLVMVIDLVEENGDIHDLKTASRKWGQAKWMEYQNQVSIYHKGMEAEFGMVNTFSFQVVGAAKGGGWSQTFTVEPNPDNFADFLRRMQFMLRAIELDFYPPAPVGSWVCSPKWCGYYWTCRHIPEHRKRLPNAA